MMYRLIYNWTGCGAVLANHPLARSLRDDVFIDRWPVYGYGRLDDPITCLNCIKCRPPMSAVGATERV